VLTRRGVTAWHRALTELTSKNRTAAATRSRPEHQVAAVSQLPGPVATELINALAAVTLAGAAGGPAP
jgi:hypothetical protein